MMRVTISMTAELDSALTLAALDRAESKSRTVETYLRENTALARYVDEVRKERGLAGFALGARSREKLRRKAVRPNASSSG